MREHRKAPTSVASMSRFDSCIDRQYVRLKSSLFDYFECTGDLIGTDVNPLHQCIRAGALLRCGQGDDSNLLSESIYIRGSHGGSAHTAIQLLQCRGSLLKSRRILIENISKQFSVLSEGFSLVCDYYRLGADFRNHLRQP